MAVTYTCDRCSKKLTQREDPKGGAHRLKVSDVIPWADFAIPTVIASYAVDLCGPCNKELRDFLAPKER